MQLTEIQQHQYGVPYKAQPQNHYQINSNQPKFKPMSDYWEKKIIPPYKSMTKNELQKIETEAEEARIKRLGQYNDLINLAKKAGIPSDEISRWYEEGKNLSNIKINSMTRTITLSEDEGKISYSYDNKGRETKCVNTYKQEIELFRGSETVNCVKMERITEYSDKKPIVTLYNSYRNEKYGGVYGGKETTYYYTKDKKGKTYKCQEIKVIIINQEPNLSQIVIYAPDGSVKYKENAWMIK